MDDTRMWFLKRQAHAYSTFKHGYLYAYINAYIFSHAVPSALFGSEYKNVSEAELM